MSSFQWVWKYSCLNITHKKPYKSYEGKTNVLITFIGYVNDHNKFQQFKVSVHKSPPSTSIHFSTLLAIVPEDILAFLLYEGSTIHNASDEFVSCVYFLCRLRFSSIPTDKNLVCTRQIQTAVSLHPLKIGHVFILTYLLGIAHTTTL